MGRMPFWKFPLIARHVHKRMQTEIHQVTLFDGVDFLLQCLANHGIKLAMVTSNSYENVRLVLGPKNSSLIQYYECGVPLFRKPRRIQKVIKKCGVEPAETLYIGDEIRDLEAAQKVKAAFGAVSWGFTRIDAQQAREPHIVFNSVTEIADIITQQACA
jgi:phosphoglycolate phosphatase